MTDRTYPYKAWTLNPAFKPVEIELVKRSWLGGSTDYGDEAASGNNYPIALIHKTQAAAIAFGLQEVARMQADLEKKQASLDKKRAALINAGRAAA